MSNLHLLLRVPSFARWPLKVHIFNADALEAWTEWCATTDQQLRPSLEVVTDLGGGLLSDAGGEAAAAGAETQSQGGHTPPRGIYALPLDYEPIRDYVAKGQEIFESGRQGRCVVCDEELPTGEGLQAVCTNAGCDGVGHLSCWSRHLLGPEDAGSILPVHGRCPKCDGEVYWGDMMKELTLRVRGEKEVEKLLKKSRRRATKKAPESSQSTA